MLLCYVGGSAYHNAYFGVGSGPIFMDDVQCTSSSSQLLECPSRPILSHNCLHSDDAGVGCEGIINQLLDSPEVMNNDQLAYLSTQSHVEMVSCGWQEATWQMKAE